MGSIPTPGTNHMRCIGFIALMQIVWASVGLTLCTRSVGRANNVEWLLDSVNPLASRGIMPTPEPERKVFRPIPAREVRRAFVQSVRSASTG